MLKVHGTTFTSTSVNSVVWISDIYTRQTYTTVYGSCLAVIDREVKRLKVKVMGFTGVDMHVSRSDGIF